MKGFARSMNAPSKKTGKYRIVAITPSKKGGMLLKFPSGQLHLSVDSFTETPLYVGKELSVVEYKNLRHLAANEKLYAYALALAAKGFYSGSDVRKKLLAKGADMPQARELVFRLRQAGFLNDEEFAAAYLEAKMNAGMGGSKIYDELRFTHGVNEAILAKLDFHQGEKERALLFVKSKQNLCKNRSDEEASRHLYEALIRRGYEPGVARAAANSLPKDEEREIAALRKVCEMTVKRYQRKYNGYELKAKCFAYLLSKGFRSGDIERILEEYL